MLVGAGSRKQGFTNASKTDHAVENYEKINYFILFIKALGTIFASCELSVIDYMFHNKCLNILKYLNLT